MRDLVLREPIGFGCNFADGPKPCMKPPRSWDVLDAVTSRSTPAESPRRSRRRDRRRWIAVVLAIALHLSILALFLGSRPRPDIGAGVGVGAMDISLAGFSHGSVATKMPAMPVSAAPSPTTAPPAPTDPIKARSVLAIVSDILAIPLPEHSVTPTPLTSPPSPAMAQAMAQASGAAGAACEIGGAVQTALGSDPDTHAAILLIPIKARSAADAIVMWNGAWIAPAEVGGAAAFDTLRIAIRKVVAAAQPECRDRNIVGPRFMLIPDGDVTLVMVFGNAAWRWSDLLVDPETPTSPSAYQ